MKKSTKEIVFYTLVFLLFYVFAQASIYASTDGLSISVILLLTGLIYTGIIYALYKSLFSHQDNFRFQLTPGKFCEDPYTYSSDALKKAYCSQLSPEEIARYSCPTGFVGRPASFQRDSLSNDNFENTTCSSGLDSYAYPEPL